MIYIKYCILILLTINASAIGAQTATGSILDKSTGKPLAYANIGLPGKNMGTTTDETGHYILPLPGTNDGDTVKISIIGYLPQIVTVKDLLAYPNINLQPKNNELKEIVIKPKEFRQRVLGNTNNNKKLVIGFTSYKLGHELGTIMKIKRRPTYIDSVRINIAHCTADSVFFRLNISEEVDGEFNNILTQPIYISASTKDALENLSVNLTKYNLVVRHDFLVSVEVVRELNNKEIFLCATMLGNKAYMRSVSQAPWTKIAIAGPSISAYVTY